MHVIAPVLVLAEGTTVTSLIAATARLCGTSPTIPAALETETGEGEEGEGGSVLNTSVGGEDRNSYAVATMLFGVRIWMVCEPNSSRSLLPLSLSPL